MFANINPMDITVLAVSIGTGFMAIGFMVWDWHKKKTKSKGKAL